MKTARSATPARRAAASEQTTSAAPWSEPRKAVIRLVYGSQTMRLSGDGVAISSAVRAVGEPGEGMAGGHLGERGEQLRPWPGGAGRRRGRPGRPPRSRTAGRCAPGPAGRWPPRPGPTPGRSSPTTGSGGRSVSPSSRGRPAAPPGPRRPDGLGPGDQRDRQPPGGDVRGGPVDQPLGGVAADGGHLARGRGRAPSRRASSVAGAGPVRLMMSTTESRSIRSAQAGARRPGPPRRPAPSGRPA